jgi:hypothetical protein
MTSAFREYFNEPRVKADAIGGSEPNVLVKETESGRSDRVGFCETG